MATLVLTAAASWGAGALGFGTVGTALLGAAATMGGTLIDTALFGGGKDQNFEGPRLDSLQVTSSTEGNPINRAYGRVRVGGQIIWATALEEETAQETTGGKGGGPKATTTTYIYYANFAVGLCEGPVGYLNRIWADGKELDMSEIEFRFYSGDETQAPDSLIESVEGAGRAPAYRGLSYVVFERLDLTPFGNRVPQLTFEIIRPSPARELEKAIRGLNLIPGSTEFGYEPGSVTKETYSTSGEVIGSEPENQHQKQGVSDWTVSLDQMRAMMPNVNSVCLVVSWFFDDLRAGECQIKPKVEVYGKNTEPYQWRVGGLERDDADLITQIMVDGVQRPAYGGAPSDRAVVAAIRDLKARGYRVMFYPFMMGDVAPDNELPDPYGRANQPAFPWRGRIACHPAPGQAGSPDQTAAAGDQIAGFVGTAGYGDFGLDGDEVTYSGPDEWSYRRFILHMTKLAEAAGGVHSFCIGSEMVGLTQTRDGAASYPFVTALKALAGDVRAALGGGVKIGYAADWSEYHSHRPGDGSGDVIFNMDPLWSDASIDFIGIDNYFPLSDWRRGKDHADYDAARGHVTPYDLDYLQSNIEGGEWYDFYYASDEDRAAQIRTPIYDGAHGEDWIYRQKDVRGWWLNGHHNRPGGVRDASATGWQAQSKPVWFTELGCPALDLGTNQPNVFFDPKSSESALPHFSSGARDDVQQHRALQATLGYWADDANNPVSAVYGGKMLDVDQIHIWSWDARPFPSWPLDATSWGDASNWPYGHWLSSRAGMVYAPDLMAHIASDYGFDAGDFEAAYGACDGYVIDSTMSLRDAWSPLALAFGFDLIETGDQIKAVSRRAVPVRAVVDVDGLFDGNKEAGELATITRTQESELPNVVRVRFVNANKAYQTSSVEARASFTGSLNTSESSIAVVLDDERAQGIADYLLSDAWASRERGRFALMPSNLAIEPGDVVRLETQSAARELRLTGVNDGEGRDCEASAFVDAQLSVSGITYRASVNRPARRFARVLGRFMDLPLLASGDDAKAGYVALSSDPWPGAVVLRSQTESNWQQAATAETSAILGESLEDFAAGPVGVFDLGNSLDVEIYSGALLSVSDLDLFAGANAFAIQGAGGAWEIFQAGNAELVGPGRYRLSRLLRGQRGTEWAMGNTPSGAALVYLGQGINQVDMSLSDIGRAFYWRYGPLGAKVGSDAYTTVSKTFEGVGLKPFAPVHARRRIADNGDHVLTWIRRTRADGDSWSLYQIPLGEDIEAYAVEILTTGGELLRTLEASGPSVTYSAAMRAGDGVGAGYQIRVYQISQTIGRGYPLAAGFD